MKPKRTQEHELLRKTVRDFLRETAYVPYRAVDCNQDRVDRLRGSLVKLSGFRFP